MTTRYILEYRSEYGHIWRRVEFKTMEEARALYDSLYPSIPRRPILSEPAIADRAPVAEAVAHVDGRWCDDLHCGKCYSADFRFKYAAPPAPAPVADAVAVLREVMRWIGEQQMNMPTPMLLRVRSATEGGRP